MGGGVAFLDFDNDGSQDLLFINPPTGLARLHGTKDARDGPLP